MRAWSIIDKIEDQWYDILPNQNKMSKQTTGQDTHYYPRVSSQTTSESNVTTPASKFQEGGAHYKRCPIQPWDYTIANDLDYFQGSIIKYVTRWKDKGGIEDLRKARHFLDKYIEVMVEKHKDMYERPDGQKDSQT